MASYGNEWTTQDTFTMHLHALQHFTYHKRNLYNIMCNNTHFAIDNSHEIQTTEDKRIQTKSLRLTPWTELATN
jgi:hypothetical protein